MRDGISASIYKLAPQLCIHSRLPCGQDIIRNERGARAVLLISFAQLLCEKLFKIEKPYVIYFVHKYARMMFPDLLSFRSLCQRRLALCELIGFAHLSFSRLSLSRLTRRLELRVIIRNGRGACEFVHMNLHKWHWRNYGRSRDHDDGFSSVNGVRRMVN